MVIFTTNNIHIICSLPFHISFWQHHLTFQLLPRFQRLHPWSNRQNYQWRRQENHEKNEHGQKGNKLFIPVHMTDVTKRTPNPATWRPIKGHILEKSLMFVITRDVDGNLLGLMSWPDTTGSIQGTALFNVDFVKELFQDQITLLCTWKDICRSKCIFIKEYKCSLYILRTNFSI